MKFQSILAVALGGAMIKAQGDKQALQLPVTFPKPGAITSQGCYNSAARGWYTIANDNTRLLTMGGCVKACTEDGATVAALKGAECFCGAEYPPEENLVEDSQCNYPCPGYSLEACGGIKPAEVFSVYNLGVEVMVPHSEPGFEDDEENANEEEKEGGDSQKILDKSKKA